MGGHGAVESHGQPTSLMKLSVHANVEEHNGGLLNTLVMKLRL
jgi:hypothetical protein